MALTLGFVGLGMMGKPMAMRLLKAGYQVTLYNRTKAKAEELLHHGAAWADTPRRVAERSDVVLSVVSDSSALEEISLGHEGIAFGLRPQGIHIDLSTVSPQTTRKLDQSYQERNLSFLHTPVLGSVPQAAEGSLLIFAGGNPGVINRCKEIFDCLGQKLWQFEEVTQATHMKLICNLFISSMITALSEALLFAQKSGIKYETVLDILASSALNAPIYQSKGKSMANGDFTPRFFVEHMLKDMRLILDTGNSIGISLQPVEAIAGLFEKAKAHGYGKEDYSAVIKVL